MRKIDNFTKEEVERIFKESKSFDSVARKLGYKDNSGSVHEILKEYAKENNIDTAHFTGQGHNRGNIDLTRFQKGVPFKGLRESLLAIRQYKCEKCGNTEWLGKEIPLEVHHIDGDRLNNELSNLKLLCPNCHSQTENYCGRNIGKSRKISDDEFLEALKTTSTIKEALIKIGVNYLAKNWYEKARQLMSENNISQLPRKITSRNKRKNKEIKHCSICGKEMNQRTKGCICRDCLIKYPYIHRDNFPEKKQLETDIITMSFQDVGKKYGVSGNAIRKWCKYYDLPYRKSDITGRYESP